MQVSTAEKLNKIQSLFDAGKSHKEIAAELGYKNIKSYYHYLYKHDANLRYDKQHIQKKLQEVPKKGAALVANKDDKPAESVSTGNMKAESIVYMLGKGEDLNDVAKRTHFQNVQALADYMKSKGYRWDTQRKNYSYSQSNPVEGLMALQIEGVQAVKTKSDTHEVNVKANRNSVENHEELLHFLYDKREVLEELLGKHENTETVLHRYVLPGVSTLKSFNMVEPLKQLIMEFSREHNIHQKDILSIAMIEFLKKYGYEAQVKVTFGL